MAFPVVQRQELLNRLNLAAKEAARNMDMKHLRELGNNGQFDCLYAAPTLIIVSDNEQAAPMEADCAAATENLLLAAESIGLGSCWIFFVLLAFYSQQGADLRKELKIPEGYKPSSSAVLGYKKVAVNAAPDRKHNLISYIH
jgi:nitroreductase